MVREKTVREKLEKGEVLQIPYRPRPYQKEIHADTHRFKLVVFHRQAGKTLFAINELIKQAEMAMHRAKESGRNAVRFFEPKK